MLRHITATTRTVLAITTLTALVAIDQAVTSNRIPISAPEQTQTQTQTTITNDARGWPMDAGNAPLYSLQLAVLLEGFDWQALSDAARYAYASTP
ncbi:hypothetical protein P0D73_42285 [Paraburkholderia sp. RL18-101-BIB-B]|uniref:hypothetical protein n=1 Tax=unclassified Paraburkholderia TaxID=2615204 RepID=UPI0038BA885E